jgi:hypothetical protein|tara:strand:- start:942 stop:1142 length:201 start_codon:yes stop_codon:yes gene_type:complete
MKTMEAMNIDQSQVKKLWYALYGLCYAVERLELQDEINNLVDEDTNLGAHMFARVALDQSVIESEE